MAARQAQNFPEGFTFAYAKVTVHYEQQDTKGGTIGKPVEAFFDQTTVEVG